MMLGDMQAILDKGSAMTADGRPSRHHVLMANAHAFSLLSTCTRAGNGALITLEGRILSTGYNGAPAGMPHCNHACDCGYPGEGGLLFADKHLSNCSTVTGCQTAVHAETNAVAWAARYGVSTHGTTMYCTSSPCINCARLIINAGIERVIYLHAYRLTDGLDLLRAAPSVVEVYQL